MESKAGNFYAGHSKFTPTTSGAPGSSFGGEEEHTTERSSLVIQLVP